MKETMEKDQSDAQAQEAEAVASYEERNLGPQNKHNLSTKIY